MKTKMTAKGLALLTLVGALSVAAPQAAMADYLNTCDLSTKISELQGWGSDTSKNIMVWKASAEQSIRFSGGVSSGTIWAVPCDSYPKNHEYRWVVFSGDGEFVRKGDGGYRNWAFYGSWDRPSDNVVKFHRR
ncbi:hypothetical protein ACWEIJ_11035 [Lentzea sp. NPDC004789]